MKKKLLVSALVLASFSLGLWLFSEKWPSSSDRADSPSETVAVAVATVEPTTSSPEPTQQASKSEEPTAQELVEKYRDLKLIDSHNHDASGYRYRSMLDVWKHNAVNQVVLFGDVSEPSAVLSDQVAFEAYQQNPDVIIPFFSGFDMHDKSSLEVVKNNLEQGYFGLGEIAAASSYSPMVSKVAWKGESPMDGYLPDIYDLAAKYKAPLLLHIDPPNGIVIDKLEEALDQHPDTLIIFAHANAYNPPENIEELLSKHPNLYIDFYAEFTALNPDSTNTLEDFFPVMRRYPDKFVVSTDSGYFAGEEAAIGAIYQLLDKLDDPELARKIAHDNMDTLIQNQPATETQLSDIRKKAKETGKTYDLSDLSKVEAGQILWGAS
jgi:predicted TIM-barrel fold metal-dependent hydrolase